MPDPALPAERVVVVGYYGHGNIGDESILRSLLAGVHRLRPELGFYVLCGGSANLPSHHPAASRAPASPGKPGPSMTYVPRLAPARLLSAMRRSRMLVLGGGGLIQDVTSLRSLMYYLGLIWTAKRLGLPVAICGGGIGPVDTALGRWLAGRILPQIDVLALRDRRSIEVAESLGVPAERLVLTADPAFSLGADLAGGLPAGEGLEREVVEALVASGVPKELVGAPGAGAAGRLLGVALRPPMLREDEAAVVQALRGAVAGQGVFPVLVPFHPEQDTALLERIAAAGVDAAVLRGVREPETLFGVIRRLRAMVSMRLHGVIFAVAAGVPSVALPYNPKVDALAEDVPQIRYVQYPRIDAAELGAAIEEAWLAPDQLRDGLLAAAGSLRSRAQANARLMVETLDRPKGGRR